MTPKRSPGRAGAGHTPAPYEHHFRGQRRVTAALAACPTLLLLSRHLWAEEACDRWPRNGCSTRGRSSRTGHCVFVVQTQPCYFPFSPSTTGEGMGGEGNLKVCFVSHFTVRSIWLIHGTPTHPMPPCRPEHFSFGRRKEGGKFSDISEVQREHMAAHTLSAALRFQGRKHFHQQGPSFVPTAVRGKFLKETKLRPCSCSKAERVLISSHEWCTFTGPLQCKLVHKYTLKAFESACYWTTGLTTQSGDILLCKYMHGDCSRSSFSTQRANRVLQHPAWDDNFWFFCLENSPKVDLGHLFFGTMSAICTLCL